MLVLNPLYIDYIGEIEDYFKRMKITLISKIPKSKVTLSHQDAEELIGDRY